MIDSPALSESEARGARRPGRVASCSIISSTMAAVASATALLFLAAAAAVSVSVSGLPAINVTTMAFDEGYAPLFGHDNILRSADGRTVSLLLDRSTGE